MAALRAARANQIVIDERQLTKSINARDVREAYDEFRQRAESKKLDGMPDADLFIQTDETSERRARELLDLGEAALERLFGTELKIDISVVTAQSTSSAKLRVTEAAVRRVAAATGLVGLGVETLEDFVAQRIATEYQLLLLRFLDTDVLPDPALTIEVRPSGRSLRVSRAQIFR